LGQAHQPLKSIAINYISSGASLDGIRRAIILAGEANMRYVRRLVGLTVLGLTGLTAFTAVGAAQQTAGPGMVFVNATVTGAKKAYAAGLKQEQFQVWEDGKEQKISFFQAEDSPWSFVIIIGVDGFLPGRADLTTNSIRDAVAAFQKAGHPKNTYFIDELPFGSNGIYDAVSRGLNRLHQDPNPRRGMLLVTNGFDTTEGDPGHSLIEFAKKLTNVPLYLVLRTLPEEISTGCPAGASGRS
jgi:hypothetical protein